MKKCKCGNKLDILDRMGDGRCHFCSHIIASLKYKWMSNTIEDFKRSLEHWLEELENGK